MQDHYERLGLSSGATPDEIKAAYHAKLKEFPAHSHPQEFKAIRSAYEALRKASKNASEDFFEPKPIDATLDPAQLAVLRQRAMADLEVTLKDLIYLTF
jgi:curved DNA-binding protein CbpA